MEASCPGGGLVVPPHRSAQCIQEGEPHRHAVGSEPHVSHCCAVCINCYCHRATHITKSCKISRQIDRRLDAWEANEHKILVEDMACTCAQYLSTSRGNDSPEHREKIYHSLVLWGKIRLTAYWITEREKGGVLQMGDTCPETGHPVL